MRRLFRLLIIVVVLVAGAAIALPYIVPVDAYRGEIEKRASAALGREVRLAGDLKLSIFPAIGVQAGKVSVANAPGAREPLLASVENIVIGVALAPLLRREVQITRLVLDQPVINLEVDRSGAANWAFSRGDREAPVQAVGDAAEGGVSVSIADVRLNDGRISYRDLKSGTSHVAEDIDMTVGLPAANAPLRLDGALTYDGERIEIDADVADSAALTSGRVSPVQATVKSKVLTVNFNGQASTDGKANGALALDAASVSRLAEWGGSRIAADPGALSLGAKLAWADGVARLTGMKLRIGETNATGDLAIDTRKSTPFVKGTLDVDRLDLNAYMGTRGNAPSSGAAAGSGWSSEPIALEGLKAFDADLLLAVQSFTYADLKVSRGRLDAKLNSGVLTADLDRVQLYGGSGKARLVIDARPRTPTFRNTMTIDSVEVLPLLRDLIGVDRIEGIGAVSFDVSAQGTSQKAIMEALSGKGEIRFADGLIRGVDLAQIARTIQSALSGTAVGERAKTDFAELGGTFTIERGVLTNTDFRLLNPFVRLVGQGKVDLGARSMNFRVEPKAVGSIQGQGGQTDIGGIGIPFRIRGPWHDLSYVPDFEGAAQGVLENITSGKPLTEGLLPGILPSGKKQQAPSEDAGTAGEDSGAEPADDNAAENEGEKKLDPKDALKKLFGGN